MRVLTEGTQRQMWPIKVGSGLGGRLSQRDSHLEQPWTGAQRSRQSNSGELCRRILRGGGLGVTVLGPRLGHLKNSCSHRQRIKEVGVQNQNTAASHSAPVSAYVCRSGLCPPSVERDNIAFPVVFLSRRPGGLQCGKRMFEV